MVKASGTSNPPGSEVVKYCRMRNLLTHSQRDSV